MELAAVVEGDLAVLHHDAVDPVAGLIRRLVIIIPDLIALRRLHRQLDRAVEVAIGQKSLRCAEHRVAVFHRGYAGGPHGIAHLGPSVQCEGAGVGLDAHVLIGGDIHLEGAVVVLEGTPLVLGVVPQAVLDGCSPLRRDLHLFGAAAIIELGDRVDVRRGDGRVEGKGLTDKAPVGVFIIIGDAVVPRLDAVVIVIQFICAAVGFFIGIQPAVAQAHEGSVLQVLGGIGLFTVPGQLRGHQHNTKCAVAGVDTVCARKGQILIGIADVGTEIVVPLFLIAHIAQGWPVRHGVTHRHQHHILPNIGEGLGGVRPACAASAAGRAQGVIPVEERALSATCGQLNALALAHNVGEIERWLYDLGIIELAAVWIVRRRM